MKLEIDRTRVKQAFAQYVRQYNAEDEKILLKIRHTYRVAEISEQIAIGLGLSAYDTDLAWLIGMLHDIGRFEQLRQYGTFVDADSIDHAHFGVDLLFREGLIREYVDALLVGSDAEGEEELTRMSAESDAGRMGEAVGISVGSDVERMGEAAEISVGSDVGRMGEVVGISVGSDVEKMGEAASISIGFDVGEMEETWEDLHVIRVAIWNHSAYRIEEGLDERTLLFCKIIRDADKVDIFKVAYDTPIEVLYRCTLEEFRKAEVTSEVMQAYREKHAVLRSLKKTPVDFLVGHVALVFELEFPVSRNIAQEQGYVQKLLSFQSDHSETAMAFENMRKQMEEFLSESS